jgi:hypothetical protein
MKIFYFTPYDSRGLGYAYREYADLVENGDDFICFMDADVMLFPSDWGVRIQSTVEKFPNFDLYTIPATRTFKTSRQQVMWEGLREQENLVELQSAARNFAWHYQSSPKVSEIEGSVSGYFLLFRKKLIWEVNFPLVGSRGHHLLGIDTQWVTDLRKAGKKIGIMNTLLAVHYYRLGTGEQDKSHLQ